MSIENPTNISQLLIGGVDRKADMLRLETWRSVNSVGLWKVALRNINGQYNNTFDVHDTFRVDINGVGNTLMEGRLDGPGVVLENEDAEDIWTEYIILSGYDQGQDLLFHNDFEYLESNSTQTLDTVMNDVINVELAGLTNITYAGFLGTPAVGGVEFRRGSGFLSSIQEVFQRAEYLFYVDDALAFQLGTPGWDDSGVTINCVEGDFDNNVIGKVKFNRNSGDKLYNRIYVYGRKPQFDAYTEYTSARWTASAINWNLSDEIVTIAPIVGNKASVRIDYVGGGAPTQCYMNIDFSIMGQDEVDMSNGEIGFWWRYDGGTSAARSCAQISLRDASANVVYFYSGNSIPGGGVASTVNSTRTYQGLFGWCRAPVGYDVETGAPAVPDTWYGPYPAAGFLWDRVTDIGITYKDAAAATMPDEMEVDGLLLPFPAIGFSEDAVSQAAYRVRPLIVNMPWIRHQLTLESKSDQILAHHKDSVIDVIGCTTVGNLDLQYAGQGVTINIPSLGLNDDSFYMSSIHHIIEPHVDVSNAYGFDWLTEIEATPIIEDFAYDMSRLGRGPVNSASQIGMSAGTGLRVE